MATNNNPVVDSKSITLAHAEWLAKTSGQWDALAYDAVASSPSKQASATAIAADRARVALPSVDRVLVGMQRVDADTVAFWDGGHENPQYWKEQGSLQYLDADGVFHGKRPEIRFVGIYEEVERENGGRLPLSGNRESLKKVPKPPATGNPPVGTNVPVEKRHWEFSFSGGLRGEPHPELNRREWLEANSRDNILLPTGTNDICPKCGYTACKCHSNRPAKDTGFRTKVTAAIVAAVSTAVLPRRARA